jgi:RNA polymerase sigma-70 factor (ECF subfamily)
MSILAEIEACVPALRRYAWSMLRHSQDADDLVQDCLVRALAHLPPPSAEMAVRPWLFTILHNISVSRWRRLRRRGREVEPPPDAPELRVAPAQDWSLSLRDLLQGLERLPEEQRRVLLLVGVEGFEYREAAAILGLPLGTVMSRLSRARDALHGHMEGQTMEGRARPALRRVK